MHTRFKLLSSLAILAAVLSPALAVVIETSPGKRIGGYLVRRDADQIVIRYRQPDGTDKEEAFDLAKVIVLQAVKADRLAELKPDKPQAYRDYAEELAEKRDDPEARETAMRLFHIAAYRDPDKLARGALLGMSQVARTPTEARRFRALAFLLDPNHSPDILKFTYVPEQGAEPSQRSLVTALQHFRRGKATEALRLAMQPAVAAEFNSLKGWIDHEQFVEACRNPATECNECNRGWVACKACNGTGKVSGFDPIFGNAVKIPCEACSGSGLTTCTVCKGARRPGALSDRDLKAILQMELAQEEDNAASTGPQKWSTILGTTPPEPVFLPSLEKLTEWDPRQCVYKDGKWVEP